MPTLDERIAAYAAAHGGTEPRLEGTGTPATAPTRLFRVEMPTGNGPFNSGLPNAEEIYLRLCLPRPVGWDCARIAREDREQMGVTDLAFFEAHGDATYACEAEADIFQWFPPEAIDYLHGLGAKLVEYVVPKGSPLLRLKRQVVFVKPDAHKVAERPLIEPARKAA